MEKINFADYVCYDETSPTCLRYRLDAKKHPFSNTRFKGGDVAGKLSPQGYYRVSIGGTRIFAHLIISEMFGLIKEPNQFVDHINGDKSDNRVSNLRLVTRAINARNIKKRATNSSGFTGVSYTTKGSNYYYCTTFWQGLDGKTHFANFPIHKLGIMVAFRDAVVRRELEISKLNAAGVGYTDRHGKE